MARYQKELKDQSRSVTGVPAPSASSVSPAPSAASVPPAMKDPQPLSSSMNVNKASAGDMVLVLGLSKDVADRVVTNRPYRVIGSRQPAIADASGGAVIDGGARAVTAQILNVLRAHGLIAS